MTLFGLTQEDVTQLFLAIVVLVNAAEAVYQKVTHAKVKAVQTKVDDTKKQVDDTKETVQELTNGTLKAAVKQAVREENRGL